MRANRDESLTLTALLRLIQGRNGGAEILTAGANGAVASHITAAGVAERAGRLAAGLATLGVRHGDRVATLSWNIQEHLEAYWAVPCMGATLHTLNPRLLAEQSAQTVASAGDRVLLVHADLVELGEEIATAAGCVEHVVVFGRPERGSAISYEDLLAGHSVEYSWPDLSEHEPAGLCFTSGTTGAPKGVVYSHRQLVLHALTMAAFDPYATPQGERVLAVVPMFHAMGWNLPYIAALTGASLVLPGRWLTPERLVSLISEQGVTFSCGVPTVWADILSYVEETGASLGVLRAILCGGSRVPEALMRAYDDHGVTVLQGWGMTETGPGAARVFDDRRADPVERWKQRTNSGWLRPLYEARIRRDDGTLARCDGTTAGEIEVRGPMVIREYFGGAGRERFVDGWLRTGDVGTLDPRGWLRLVDRKKDVIKSGGEWISSLDLEAAILEHPAVAEVAVIGIADERWMERPLACVVTVADLAVEDLRRFLKGRVPAWWAPDRLATVESLPRTSVGKVDKRALRQELERGTLQHRAP